MFKDASRWAKALEGKTMSDKTFQVLKGADVGIEWLESDPTAMLQPFIVETPEGLGMKMPDPDFTVDDVADVRLSKYVLSTSNCDYRLWVEILLWRLLMSHLNLHPRAGPLANGQTIIHKILPRGTRYSTSSR